MGQTELGEKPMLKLIAVDAFALAFATSAQAMSPAPLNQPDGMTTRVAYGCGPGRTRERIKVKQCAIPKLRLPDATWVEPKLIARVRSLVGAKYLRHATVRGFQ
jgi:hypothetical protein